MKLTVEQIAIVCHEANRAYCATLGDNSQTAWDAAPQWQKDSAVKGVIYRLQNLMAPSCKQHEEWMAVKAAEGWTYGPVKDADKKTHPCIVPYDELPEEQRTKDELFAGIVCSLADHVTGEYSIAASLGRAAYHRYGQVTDFKNFRGDPMPKWEDLGEKIQQAWIAAAKQY